MAIRQRQRQGVALRLDNNTWHIEPRNGLEKGQRPCRSGPDLPADRGVPSDLSGGTEIVWLGEGLKDDETDGHVDNIVSFVGIGRVLPHKPRPYGSFNGRVMPDNIQIFSASRDARGQAFEIIELPDPAERLRHGGQRLEFSYINSCLAHHRLVLPAFADPCDEEVFDIMQKVFPDRRVVQVPALEILPGSGNLHCITTQQPSDEALAQGRP